MKAEIIAVGTELLMGYIVNTNTSDIAQSLLDIGIGTYYQQVVGDNPIRLKEALTLASERSDLIILSGGLGPTRDDVTKIILAEFLDEPLVYDQAQLAKVEANYKRNNRKMTEGDYRQALTIENGETLFNEVGLACGLGYQRGSCLMAGRHQHYIVLPGPPYEMKHMMEHYVKPYLSKHREEKIEIESMYLNFYGLGEARVAQAIDDLILSQTNPTVAIYARPRLTTIRITASALDKETAHSMNSQMAKQIKVRMLDYYIGSGEHLSFEAYILTMLKEGQKTLSVAESLTGGLVMTSLTAVPGSSDVLKGGFVTYQTAMKETLLGVNHDLIEEYSVVSEQVAQDMAEQCLSRCKSDFALSLTGVAGPGPLGEQPAGRVFIALAIKNESTQIKELMIDDKPREIVREIAKYEALNLLRKYLTEK
ncbi:competence/damage-inducible protein A [Fundicoccus sp. Sow4_D5]|uniref:competence/damage-inducible protein A n=1 Tax=unclassified Fundicoccus TaxID=2761543 RepID=UPI003F90114A